MELCEQLTSELTLSSLCIYTDFLRLVEYRLVIEYTPPPVRSNDDDNCMNQSALTLTLDRVRS